MKKKDQFDFLIIGAGFAGATLANKLTKKNKKVLVVEKRNHIGGNCYDYYNEKGVLVHKYGPHYFRTNYPEVKTFLSQFTEWIPQRYKVRVSVKNKIYSFPINRTTLNEYFGLKLKTKKQAEDFLKKISIKIDNPQNAEEQVLATAGKDLYQAFFKGYTQKQWGMDPKKLGPSVTARIPVRTDTNDDYTSAKFQAIPKHGYTYLFTNMLAGIPVMLNTDFADIQNAVSFKELIYTGPIDTYFNYKFGKLPYRSLEFKFTTYNKEYYQDWAQINYPNEHKYTRIFEAKHVTKQISPYTTISKEFPTNDGDPYYPIPNKKNQEAYLNYVKEAKKLKNVHFIGRLATYQYLNMDEVVKQALDLFEQKFG